MHFEKYQLPYKCKGPCLSKCVYIHYGVLILRAICHRHFPSSAKHMNMKKVSVKNNFTKALQTVVKIISIFFSFQERQSSNLMAFLACLATCTEQTAVPPQAPWQEHVHTGCKLTEAK